MTDRPAGDISEPDARQSRLQADIAHTLENAVRVHIPRFFHTSFGGPFRNCIGCAEALAALPPYLIVKEVRGTETIVEYAICASCHGELEKQYSPESVRCLNDLFLNHVDFRANFAANLAAGGSWRNWVARCVLTGEPRRPDSSYQAVALCHEGDLLLSAWPYVFVGRGLQRLEECLSPETRATRDRFVRQRLGLPAILADHPATRLRQPPV